MMRTPNARPDRCEICSAALPLDAQGQPRYRCVLVEGPRHIPIGLRACLPCHYAWLHPDAPALQPVLILVS